jgi:hypothetical protein
VSCGLRSMWELSILTTRSSSGRHDGDRRERERSDRGDRDRDRDRSERSDRGDRDRKYE